MHDATAQQLSEGQFNLTSLQFKLLDHREKEARSIGENSPIFQNNVKGFIMMESGVATPREEDRDQAVQV